MITQDEFDRAQIILGRKGKQRPKTREFAYTGIIRCGECGAMVTAEEKINRYGKRYVYYHCTHRKNLSCTQGSIELKELERQINEILAKLEIPESFKDWAIQRLNELHDTETHEQTLINGSVDKAYTNCLTEINNLIKLKISPMNADGSLLPDDSYQRQMAELQKEKKQLEKQKKNLGERVDQWEKQSRETFRFACYAVHKFNTGTLQEKRTVLQGIGSNFLLQDKTLRLDVPKPLKIVEGCKIVVDKLLERFEPEEKSVLTTQIATLFDESLTLRRGGDSNP